MTKLIIVESPAKCKKIELLLGKEYICKASFGHIRKLKKVNVKNNFETIYETLEDKKKVIQELRKLSHKCSETIIASDLDREGEAIAYDLIQELELDIKDTKRIIFNEISKSALTKAILDPKRINMDVYYSQKTRSILDMLIGFGLSDILYKFIKVGLSGGRCQSPALKIIYEEEQKINTFIPEHFYKVNGLFHINKEIINTHLDSSLKDKEEVNNFLELCKKTTFSIKDIKKNESNRNPSEPFITSSLQHEVSIKYGIGPQECMKIAQKLYETGKITYMRTDCVSLSNEVMDKLKDFIIQEYGIKYYNKKQYKSKKSSQEAHEAIRPVYIEEKELNHDYDLKSKKIYNLIWKRTVASQMKPMKLFINSIVIDMNNSKHYFTCSFKTILFDGFSKVYSVEEEKDKVISLEKIKVNHHIELDSIISKEDITKSPSRYTETDLIRELEKRGIGRPSTYSNIVSTNIIRNYVEKKNSEGSKKEISIITLKNNVIQNTIEHKVFDAFKNKLVITDIGILVNNFINKHFHKIINYSFTSDMEKKLDLISSGNLEWKEVLTEFYNLFSPIIELVKKNEVSMKQSSTIKKILGKNEEDQNIIVTHSKYGLMVAIENIDNKYIKMASLPKHKKLDNVSLEEALELLKYPLNIGEYKNNPILIKLGPYGKYISYNSKNYALKEENEDLKHCIEVIEKTKSNILKTFDNIEILSGPYGNYISVQENKKKKNIPLDKKLDIETLTKEKVEDIIKKHIPKKHIPFKKK